MTTVGTSPAEQLDRAIDHVLAGHPQAAVATASAGEVRPLIELAGALRDALPILPVAPSFEMRLGARLRRSGVLDRGARALRHPNRLLVTGAALSSAALGVGVTAYAVWRSSRRHAGGAHRLLSR